MITLVSTLLSFLAGGLPRLLDFFQDKGDKKHELEMARLQIERELQLAKEGYLAQAKIEEIRTDQIEIGALRDEKIALYQHDTDLAKGADKWVINARAMVRPIITYGMFAIFLFVEIFGFLYAWRTGVDFTIALEYLWTDETITIWSSIISFWFGSQAFKRI
jgi:hypothetical protein